MSPRAIGLVVREVSGANASEHAHAIERSAHSLGFNWVATYYADERTEANYIRMINRANHEGVDAIFLPNTAHLDERDIDVLVTHVDVYCVAEQQRHTTCTAVDPAPEGTLPEVVS